MSIFEVNLGLIFFSFSILAWFDISENFSGYLLSPIIWNLSAFKIEEIWLANILVFPSLTIPTLYVSPEKEKNATKYFLDEILKCFK